MFSGKLSIRLVLLSLLVSTRLGGAQTLPTDNNVDISEPSAEEDVPVVLTITASPIPETTSIATIDFSSLLASLSSEISSSQTLSTVDFASLISSVSASIESVASVSRASVSSVLATMTTSSSVSTSASTYISPTPTPSSTSSVLSSSIAISSPTSIAAPSTAGSSPDHRTITIILGVVFALLGISLIFISIVLIRRYRNGQTPFTRFAQKRGATPIDDEEIATWRGNTQEMARDPPHGHQHQRTNSSIIFTAQPGYTWTVQATSSPTSMRDFQDSPKGPPASAPPLQARAPNSRSGLTDEAIPGADPFLQPLKSHPSRLSKVPGHGRVKSRRSSMSVGSIMDAPGAGNWNETYDEEMTAKYMKSHSRNGSFVGTSGTGLAPRPQTAKSLKIDGRVIA